MATDQILNLIKLDYNAKESDYTAKYSTKENSDAFNKVFESAKKAVDYDYENSAGYIPVDPQYENRDTEYSPRKEDCGYENTEPDKSTDLNKIEKTEKTENKNDEHEKIENKTDKNPERNPEKITESAAKPNQEVKNDSKDAVEVAIKLVSVKEHLSVAIQQDTVIPAQKADKASIRESASDTAGKLLVENAVAKAKDLNVAQVPDSKDIKSNAKDEIKEIKADAKNDLKILSQEVKGEKSEIKDIKADEKSIKAGAKELVSDMKAENAENKDIKQGKIELKNIDVLEGATESKEEIQDDLNQQSISLEVKPKTQKIVSQSMAKSLEIKDELKLEQVKVSLNSDLQKPDKAVGLNLDMNQQKQDGQSLQQELKSTLNPSVVNNGDTSAQKIDMARTAQFDKVLSSKHPDSTQQSVLNQVKQATAQLSSGKTEVTIALRPDNLGRVNLNLVSQNGVLSAQITAESNQVREMLSNGLDTLRQNLSEQGINVNKITINVQEPAPSNNNSDFGQAMKEFNNSSSQANTQHNKQNYDGNALEQGFDNELEQSELNNDNDNGTEFKSNRLVDYKV